MVNIRREGRDSPCRQAKMLCGMHHNPRFETAGKQMHKHQPPRDPLWLSLLSLCFAYLWCSLAWPKPISVLQFSRASSRTGCNVCASRMSYLTSRSQTAYPHRHVMHSVASGRTFHCLGHHSYLIWPHLPILTGIPAYQLSGLAVTTYGVALTVISATKRVC